jgi:transcriptional regulator with XRE-family HTH domain
VERLLIERAKQRLSLQELAERSGVNAHTISDIERGLRKPRATTLAKLGEALGLEPEELLGKIRTNEQKLATLSAKEQRLLFSVLSNARSLNPDYSQESIMSAARTLYELHISPDEARDILKRINPLLTREFDQLEEEGRDVKERSRQRRRDEGRRSNSYTA